MGTNLSREQMAELVNVWQNQVGQFRSMADVIRNTGETLLSHDIKGLPKQAVQMTVTMAKLFHDETVLIDKVGMAEVAVLSRTLNKENE